MRQVFREVSNLQEIAEPLGVDYYIGTPAERDGQVSLLIQGGGSMSYVDLDARMAFGYAPNRWITGSHEQDRSMNVLKAGTAACRASRGDRLKDI